MDNKISLDNLVQVKSIAARILSKLQEMSVNGYQCLDHAQEIQWMAGFNSNIKDQIRALKGSNGQEVIEGEIVQPGSNVDVSSTVESGQPIEGK